jgi:hypothetical protein
MRESFQVLADRVVTDYIEAHADKTDSLNFSVYTVWSCFILGNWKCLVSSTITDGMYYEVTFNSKTSEIFLDAYKKFQNVVVKP